MQVGMIGLGRMGANMVRRLIRKGHRCVVFNRSPQAVNELVTEKAIGATSLMIPSPIFLLISRRETSSLTVGILITSMISGAQSNSLPKSSTTSMSAPAEEFGAWSEATA